MKRKRIEKISCLSLLSQFLTKSHPQIKAILERPTQDEEKTTQTICGICSTQFELPSKNELLMLEENDMHIITNRETPTASTRAEESHTEGCTSTTEQREHMKYEMWNVHAKHKNSDNNVDRNLWWNDDESVTA